jgi:hypothetical protein
MAPKNFEPGDCYRVSCFDNSFSFRCQLMTTAKEPVRDGWIQIERFTKERGSLNM